jgi:ATP-dependent DNA helicase RecQ
MTYEGCLMEYLVNLLDDPTAAPCGQCARCRGRGLPRETEPELVQAAISFLRRDLRPIQPRKQWPAGAVDGLSGRIAPPNEAGMALCVLGDAGWGREVQRGRSIDGAFSSELVAAAARAIEERWHPDPAPTWLTFVPSASRPGFVEGFARALARRLDLPFVAALTARPGSEPQAAMQNSVQQLRNVHEKLEVAGAAGAAVPDGPVLLVDDLVDSGWTLTVAGDLLRSHGSGPVFPFALATVSGRD